jgi:hypothetical protein
VREVTLLEYGDDPMVEPGEMMVRVLTAEQPGEGDELPISQPLRAWMARWLPGTGPPRGTAHRR